MVTRLSAYEIISLAVSTLGLALTGLSLLVAFVDRKRSPWLARSTQYAGSTNSVERPARSTHVVSEAGSRLRATRRLLAWFLDIFFNYSLFIAASVLLGIAQEAGGVEPEGAGDWIALFLFDVVFLLGVMMSALVLHLLLLGTTGRSFGLLVMGGRLVRTNTSTSGSPRAGFFRSLTRWVVGVLGAMLWINYVVMLVRSDSRGLNDVLAGTEVISVR